MTVWMPSYMVQYIIILQRTKENIYYSNYIHWASLYMAVCLPNLASQSVRAVQFPSANGKPVVKTEVRSI